MEKEKDEMMTQTTMDTLYSDRYRSLMITFGISIPIMLAIYDVKGSICWTIMLVAIVIMGMFDKFNLRIDKLNAFLNTTLEACYVGLIGALILLPASYMYPELVAFIKVLAVVFVMALVICWAIVFRLRTYTARKTEAYASKTRASMA